MEGFNKQWKRIFEFTHINEYGFFVDTDGVCHAPVSIREVRETDRPWQQIEEGYQYG